MTRALAAAALIVLAACGPASDAAHPTGGDALSEQLAALGYALWAPVEANESAPGGVVQHDRGRTQPGGVVQHDRGRTQPGGVVQHDRGRTQPGVNLYSSRALPGATLVDLEGRVLHAWRAAPGAAGWNHVEWAGEGELLVVTQAPSLQRLDRDSNVLWEQHVRAHHDVALDADGRIHTLERTRVDVPGAGGAVTVLGENLLTLAPDGRVLARFPLHEIFADRLTAARLAAAAAQTPDPRTPWQRLRAGGRALPADVFHANSLEILTRDVPGLGDAGDVLLSLRNLDEIAVIDPTTRVAGWRFGPGELERQHHASLVDGGNVLVFDNGRRHRAARVVEIDPRTRQIVWSHAGPPGRPLRSPSQGGAERLANGNVLVIESERGRVLEVTREGETVWEFLNPQLDAAREARASIYRMTRLPEEAARALALR